MNSVTVLFIFGFIVSTVAGDARLPSIPKCRCADGLSCECCANFQVRRRQHNVCLRPYYNENEMKITMDIMADGIQVASRTIGSNAIPICAPIPGLTLCVTNRELSFNGESAKICPTVSVKKGFMNIYSAPMPCLGLNNGIFNIQRE